MTSAPFPFGMRFRSMLRIARLVLPALALLAVLPAGAGAATAPGRVTYPLGGPSPRQGVDPWAVGAAALAPGGAIVTAGMDGAKHLVLSRVLRDGSLDTTFGAGGVATLTVPGDPQFVGPLPNQVVLQPDGRAIVATLGAAAVRGEGNRLVLTRVLTDGRPDPSFGSGGSVVTAVQPGTGIALQPDGRIVTAGATGAFGAPRRDGTVTSGTRAWVVTRLNADGTPDTSFGSAGIATLPGDSGAECAVLGDGRIATTGSREGVRASFLAVLRSDGTPDPGFNGGTPVRLGGWQVGGIVARADGALDVLTTNPGATTAGVQRLRADGTPDPAFGDAGTAAAPAGALGTRLLAGPGGTVVTVATPYTRLNLNFFSSVIVARLRADGTPDPAWGGATGTRLQPAFGGGYGSIGATIRLPVVGPLRQNGSSLASVLVRPDGGLVLAGSVAVTQYTGEGEGFMHDEAAIAAFRPDLQPDPAFGGRQQPATVALAVPAQRAAIDATRRARRAVRVTATTSGPGIARIDVLTGRTLLARANAPVFAGGRPQRLRAHLTAAGRRILPRAHDLRVTVRARFRDLLTGEAGATARGILR